MGLKTLQSLLKLGIDLLFLAGLLLCAYGCWLWFHPLGFMVGGILIAAFAFLLGYQRPARRAGSEE